MADNEEFYLDGNEWPSENAGAALVVAPEPPREPHPRAEVRPAAPAVHSRKRGPEPLYFDIESAPDYSRLGSFGLSPLPPVPDQDDPQDMPPAAKIVEGTVEDVRKSLDKLLCPPDVWLEEVAALERKRDKPRQGVFDQIEKSRYKRQEVINLHDERRKLLSTTPEFCRIVALGWAVGSQEPQSLVIGEQGPAAGFPAVIDEAAILRHFWDLVGCHSPLIGFNILHFDLPVIFVRSALLGIAPTRMLDLKPWGKDCIDLFALRFTKPGASGDGRPRKLKVLAPLFGIDIPAGDTDGSDVERLLAEDPAMLGKYVRSDISVTRAFHKVLAGYFWNV